MIRKGSDSHDVNSLDVFHVTRRFVLVAGLVAAYGAHLFVVIVVLVRILGSVLVGVLLDIL